MFELIVATHNRHKLEELEILLGADNEHVKLKCLKDFPSIPPPIEDADDFEGNASIKALNANSHTQLASIGDDSGIVVEALNGEPGIRSARYAGENATDVQNLNLLLQNMVGKTNRRAKFVCVLAIAYEGEIIATFRGEVEGKIIDTPLGGQGFGYDPIFIPNGYDKTFAELSSEVKNKISHRANAVSQAVEFFENLAMLMPE